MNDLNSLRSLGDGRLRLVMATLIGLVVAVLSGLVGVGFMGNPVKNLMLISGGFMLLVGTLQPRFGLYLLIIASASLDLIKRFLVLFGVGSLGDVTGVLVVAPLILTGVFLGVFVLYPIFTKRMLSGEERRMTMFTLLPILVAFAIGVRRGDFTVGTLGAVTNKSAYLLLLPIVYALYRRTGLVDVTKLLRFLVLVYVPVALYGIHQYTFGLAQFEIDYLRSGLTITTENLYDIHPRPFSTLNSPHAFCIAMGVMFILSSAICLNPVKAARGFLSTKGRFLLPPMFLIACVLSLGRAGWVVSGLGFIGLFAFRTKTRTVLFYSIFMSLFSLLVWKADYIFTKLDDLQQMLPGGTDFKDQAFRLGTYSERLYGFQNVLTNRQMWTWFGNPDLAYRAGENAAREEVVHDTLGQILVDYGFVGMGLIVVLLIAALIHTHRRVLSTRDRSAASLARGFLSAGMAVIFGGMLTGNHIGLFPINVLFWCMAGALVTLTRLGGTFKEQSPQAAEAESAPLKIAPPLRRRQRDADRGTALLPGRTRGGKDA